MKKISKQCYNHEYETSYFFIFVSNMINRQMKIITGTL